MASPRHLDTTVCPYEYHQIGPLTDVETGGVGIISSLRTYLVTNQGWTEPTTNLFKSPPDSFGRFYDLLFTRIAAGNLEIRMRDDRAHTLFTKRIQIDVAGTSVRIWAGKFFCRVESLRATSEVLWTEFIDESPDPLGSHVDVVLGNAYRTSADSADGNGSTIMYGIMWETDVAAAAQRNDRGYGGSVDTAGAGVTMIYGDGSLYYGEVGVAQFASGSYFRQVGRLFHAMLCDSNIAFATEKTLPVDGNNTATFKVVGLGTLVTSRLMYRKSDP